MKRIEVIIKEEDGSIHREIYLLPARKPTRVEWLLLAGLTFVLSCSIWHGLYARWFFCGFTAGQWVVLALFFLSVKKKKENEWLEGYKKEVRALKEKDDLEFMGEVDLR